MGLESVFQTIPKETNHNAYVSDLIYRRFTIEDLPYLLFKTIITISKM